MYVFMDQSHSNINRCGDGGIGEQHKDEIYMSICPICFQPPDPAQANNITVIIAHYREWYISVVISLHFYLFY